jgi:Dolichyl-phosphate-mannose-protein mannosyltransferase
MRASAVSRKAKQNVLGRAEPVVSRYLIAACLVASFVQSCFFAWAMVPDPDETVHVFLGRMAITGQISLFQDELPGFRAPLPFYFFGLSQLVFDRNIVAARITSAVLGVLCLVLVMLLATRTGGRLCGILTLLFAVTESALIGFFAQTSYHSLTSFFLLTALYFVFGTESRHKHILAMLACSCLFFTRTLMLPVIPFAMLYLLWKEKIAAARLAIVAAAIVPPLAFFLYDPRHLKLLAYVPLLGGFVRSYGYQSPERMMAPLQYDPENTPIGALLILARWYKPWLLAAVVFAASVAAIAIRGRSIRAFFSSRAVNVSALIAIYLAAMHLLGSRGSWTGAVGYLASFGILGAIILGFGFSTLIEKYCATPMYRRGFLVSLATLFAWAPLASPPPALPRAVPYDHPPTRALATLGEALRTTIPAESRIFNLGATQALYTGGLTPYLRQNFAFNTLSSITDERVRTKSGLWGEREIEEWLGHDADYAVIAPASVGGYRDTCSSCVALVESMLARNFQQIRVLTDDSGQTYIVYKRSRHETRGSVVESSHAS